MTAIVITLIIVFFILTITASVCCVIKENKRKNIRLSAKEKLSESNFKIDKTLNHEEWSIYVDHTSKRWCILNSDTNFHKILNYDDLISFDITEDKETVFQGRAGSVIAGGLLLGELGAFAGANRSRKISAVCNSLIVEIKINNVELPNVNITLINSETKRSSITYKSQKEIASNFNGVLSFILSNSQKAIEQNKQLSTDQSTEQNGEQTDEQSTKPASKKSKDSKKTEVDAVSEIKRYKQLLDEGIITQEEFDQKKKDLLKL